MSGLKFPLAEYRCEPDDYLCGFERMKWLEVMSVDLRSVTGVRIWGHLDGRFTQILLGNSQRWVAIDVPYKDFVLDWSRAMAL